MPRKKMVYNVNIKLDVTFETAGAPHKVVDKLISRLMDATSMKQIGIATANCSPIAEVADAN